MHDPTVSKEDLYGGLREQVDQINDAKEQARKLWPSEDLHCGLNRAQRRHPERYGIPGPGARGRKRSR